jgi:hypothetical protein
MGLDPDSEKRLGPRDSTNLGSEKNGYEKKCAAGLTEREGGGWLAGELPGNAGEDEPLNQDLHSSGLRVQESGARLRPRPIKKLHLKKLFTLFSRSSETSVVDPK